MKRDWLTWLQERRTRELSIIFARCPDGLFHEGLELGAGNGFQSTLLPRYVSHLVATDFDPEILKHDPVPSVEYRVCDAEEVGSVFEARQFDLVFSSNLLEHVPDAGKALRGIWQVLKDAGVTIHVMPNRFWQLVHLALYVPNRAMRLAERLSTPAWRKDKLNRLLGREQDPALSPKEVDRNPKTPKRRHSFFYRLVLPGPHGVSRTHAEEFRAFSKTRWMGEFGRAGFDVIAVKKGLVTSGYGFDLRFAQHALERLGFASSYIYVAVKKGSASPYAEYFR
jgi:SAM-dependent methyltransferase